MTNIALCICTYKRNLGLEKLLESIVYQQINKNIFLLTVNIVDNATPPESERIVNNFRCKTNMVINWAHEQQQGISFARNKTIELAKGADYCFFCDDDQVLASNCINELIKVKELYKSQMVYGSNPPIFEKDNVPKYIQDYFQPDDSKTGDELKFAPTNCLLIEKKLFYSYELPFDPRFAHTGGEDTFLTRQLVNNGVKLVKAKNAKAFELIPDTRCNKKWILTRVLRESAIYSYQNKLLQLTVLPNFKRICILLAKFIIGLLLAFPLFLISRKKKLTGLILIADAIGGISGYFSYKRKEYI